MSKAVTWECVLGHGNVPKGQWFGVSCLQEIIGSWIDWLDPGYVKPYGLSIEF